MAKVFRNYAHDMPAYYRDLFKFICEGFDELQKDFDGVEEEELVKYVMRKGRGHFNPSEVIKEIQRFRR